MRKQPIMELKCEKCEKPQPTNKEKSTKNWNVYDCNAVCECGGKYIMYMNGEKL